MAAKIASELKSKLQANPNAIVDLIVRLGDSPEMRAHDITSRGFTIRHTYSLIAALAVRGKASACLTLAKQTWVLAVEEDKLVHTM